MKLKVLFIAALLWAAEAVPADLLENLEFFMEMDVDEASAEESLFDVAISSSVPELGTEEPEENEDEVPEKNAAEEKQ